MPRIQHLLLLTTVAGLTSCVSQEEFRRAQAESANLRAERDAVAKYVDELKRRNDELTNEVQRLGKSAADAEWIKEQKSRLQQMIDSFGSAANLPGVTFRGSREGIVVEVADEVLFASGKTEITAEGRSTLQRLVPTLTREPRQLRIEGHTDTDPIVASPWRTNLRLSAERALVVAEFLGATGVPPERIAVSGYGEHRPRSPGTDATAKRANRRVEILLLDAP